MTEATGRKEGPEEAGKKSSNNSRCNLRFRRRVDGPVFPTSYLVLPCPGVTPGLSRNHDAHRGLLVLHYEIYVHRVGGAAVFVSGPSVGYDIIV